MSDKITVGYWYYTGMHLALCHGPLDAVTAIFVGEREAWRGNVTGSERITIDNPNLFGGEGREGGVKGDVDVCMGWPSQGVNDYLQTAINADINAALKKAGKNAAVSPVPAFRGLAALVLRQVAVSAMNPYIKPWAVEARRLPAAGWYPAAANIWGDANPAHILYELLTNTVYGLGYSPAEIDDAAFKKAADTLYAEKLGLSLIWDDDGPVETFINSVLEHISGVLYVHSRTGLFTLKLARGDYDATKLLELGPSNVLSLESFVRPAPDELCNQVVLTWHNREDDKEHSVTVHNLAAIDAVGGQVNSTAITLRGLTNEWMAKKVAMRELGQRSLPLSKVRLVANRKAAVLQVGDVFAWSWPELGIENMVLRVAGINFGTITDGRVRISAVEDVFGLPDAEYDAPAASAWVDPISKPLPVAYVKVSEVPYYLMIREITGEPGSTNNAVTDGTHLDFASVDPSTGAAVDVDGGFLAICAESPTDDHLNFTVAVSQGGKYERVDDGDYAPYAELAAAIPAGAGDTVIQLRSMRDVDLVEPDTLAYLGSEIVLVKSCDAQAGTAIVARGVLDTVPAPHGVGAPVWFFQDHQWQGTVQYLGGEQVSVKLLTHSGAGELAEADAPVATYTFQARQSKPYPPANVLLNGLSYPSNISGALTVSWTHRDRTLQTAYVVEQTEAHVGPEPGTTYTLRFYGGASMALLRTVTGITGASYTWSTETADSGGQLNTRLKIELESVVEGRVSWQCHAITVGR
jgi:hypothetical protein